MEFACVRSSPGDTSYTNAGALFRHWGHRRSTGVQWPRFGPGILAAPRPSKRYLTVGSLLLCLPPTANIKRRLIMLMKVRDTRSISPAYQIQRNAISEPALQVQHAALGCMENKFTASMLEELGRSPRVVTTRHTVAGPLAPFADFDDV